MKTIEISDETFDSLKSRVQDFGETPDSVIRRLLQAQAAAAESPLQSPPPASPQLKSLLNSTQFQHENGRGKYFKLLRFLHDEHPDDFPKLVGLKFGKRVQIADSQKIIEESGKSTFPELIPGTSYWVLTNLSNTAKRNVILTAMRALGYSLADASVAAASIPEPNREQRFKIKDIL